jgi:outer membrane biosynthesis protein TonB
MPFERLLSPAREGGPASRRASLALAFLIHAALIAVAIVSSVWHVDEVLPPTVIIRVMPLLQARARPDSPDRSQATKRPDATRPVRKKEIAATDVVVPAPAPAKELPARSISNVQTDDPRAASIAAEKGAGTGIDIDGNPGGDGTGDRPCVGDGCKPGADSPPPVEHILPPAIGAKTCAYCPPPSLPLHLRNAGQRQSVMVKICVASDGSVSKVKILQGIEPAADIAIVGAIHHWHYDPPTIDGHAVPFCYATRFTFVAE